MILFSKMFLSSCIFSSWRNERRKINKNKKKKCIDETITTTCIFTTRGDSRPGISGRSLNYSSSSEGSVKVWPNIVHSTQNTVLLGVNWFKTSKCRIENKKIGRNKSYVKVSWGQKKLNKRLMESRGIKQRNSIIYKVKKK